MKPLEHQRKLFGIVAVALVHIIEQGYMAIRTAKKSVADLPQIAASLLVFSSFGYPASSIECVDEGVEIRTVIRNAGQVDIFASYHVFDYTFPNQ